MNPRVNIFWFRRDLRLHDNAGLFHALNTNNPVVPIFIFDRNILDQLEDPTDSRVHFIHSELEALQSKLTTYDSTLDVRKGFPLEVFKVLTREYDIEKVFTNYDYEPYARERDELVRKFLKENGIAFETYKDQVIFEKEEIVKDNGKPYTVFTPYSRKWKERLEQTKIEIYPVERSANRFYSQPIKRIPSLPEIGFKRSRIIFPPKTWEKKTIIDYDKLRDFPALEGTTRLGVHLRFGTISIRELVKKTKALNENFLNELVWREFFQMILWHFPKVVNHAFKPEFERIQWRNNEKEFEAWCKGGTGYPIVDAGMRQLAQTGFMHNRVRMITASFLTKHLLIDWRWGEAWFASKLLDFELAANNGNWQWAAGSGCDAVPYFRIFNPYLQQKKYDPEGNYLRKWITEINTAKYPSPMVDHEFARKRCLEVYREAMRR